MAKGEKVDEVKQLISLGKEKGYLTYEELNNVLPADSVSSDQLDNLMVMFGEMDIEIVDSPEDERFQKLRLNRKPRSKNSMKWRRWKRSLRKGRKRRKKK
jgi:RNA polymerase primary sigma factor